MYKLEQFLEGKFLLIDKPLHWTSHDVVNKIRYKLTRYCGVKKIKVGHSGTLDPLATGLLLIATGKCTKQLQELIDADKAYEGTMRLGAVTASYDGETPEENIQDTSHLTPEDIYKILPLFQGHIHQKPPAHSAIKKDGLPAYLAAREGKSPIMPSRPIEIQTLDITKVELPDVSFRVACSKGTYIRSLVHDMGQQLGCGAWMTSLIRTRIGNHYLSDALSLEAFLQSIENEHPK